MPKKENRTPRRPKGRKTEKVGTSHLRVNAPRGGVVQRPDLLDYPQAAAFLGVAVGTLQQWVSSGLYNVPFVKLGALVRFRPSALSRWIESRERNAPAPFPAPGPVAAAAQ